MSAADVENKILSLVTKRKKGMYGPTLGKRHIYMIDDINLPNPDTYGS